MEQDKFNSGDIFQSDHFLSMSSLTLELKVVNAFQ